MKAINTYITEKLHINNTTKIEYIYHPKDKNELIECIKEKIDNKGLGTKEKPLDLNDIDTSKITDMTDLFNNYRRGALKELSDNGNFIISDWNVSSVENMHNMFYCSNFNGDISDWNVGKVKIMSSMFDTSKFNGDLSKWDVSNVISISNMFTQSEFTGENGNISNWDVRKVLYMDGTFEDTKFNLDLSNWKPENTKQMIDTFKNCPLENNPPEWYVWTPGY